MRKRHGLSKDPIYKTYCGMKARCGPSAQGSARKYYYEKGIRVCEEWAKDFLSFYTWSLVNGWAEGLAIDRIDPNKNYSPDNCQWIEVSENAQRVTYPDMAPTNEVIKKISEVDQEVRKMFKKRDKKDSYVLISARIPKAYLLRAKELNLNVSAIIRHAIEKHLFPK